MKLKISIPRVLMIVLLGILLNACKKDQQISVKQQPAPALTIQEARSWLESNDPKIMLGDRWNSTAFINEEDGHKVIKVKVNESLKDSIWTLRDILIQRNNTGDIEAVGYEVQVANSYFFTKKGAELPGANKREFIDNADFTGKVMLYTLKNKAIKGTRLLNGKIISNLIPRIRRTDLTTMGQQKDDQNLDCADSYFGDENTSCTPGGTLNEV